MYPNMVSELLWRAAFGFDQDLEPVLPKLWKGFWFWIFCAFLAYGSCSIASGAPFPLGNSFRFTKNRFRLFQKHPFRQIWRYNVTVTDLFFLNLSYLISFIIRIFFLVLISNCCLPWLRMLFAVHLAQSRRIKNRKGKFFFLVFSATYALCHAPCAITENHKQRENLKM